MQQRNQNASKRLIAACLVFVASQFVFFEHAALAAKHSGTSSRRAKEDAIRRIPWKQLAKREQRDVKQVVQHASIYRRLPTQVVNCDPELFTFLAMRPDVIVDVWRTMGISHVKLRRTGTDSFQANDGAGTTGAFRFIKPMWTHSANNRAIVYAVGAYEGKPFSKPVRATCVLLLESHSIVETNDRPYVVTQLDAFIQLEKTAFDLVARTLNPLVGRTADKNFDETLKFFSSFSRTAEKNPAGLERLIHRLENVDQKTKANLVKVCYQTAERYAEIEQTRNIRQARRSTKIGPRNSPRNNRR